MRSDMRYLKRHGRRFHLSVAVPLDLRDALGKKHLSRSLGTGDPAEARVRRWHALAELQREFTALRLAREQGRCHPVVTADADGAPETLQLEP